MFHLQFTFTNIIKFCIIFLLWPTKIHKSVHLTSAGSAFHREGTSLTPSPPPTSTQSGTPAVCSSTWPAPSSTCTASTLSTGTSSQKTCWWVQPCDRSSRCRSLTAAQTMNPWRSQQRSSLVKFQPHFTLIIQPPPTPLCKARYRPEAALIC